MHIMNKYIVFVYIICIFINKRYIRNIQYFLRKTSHHFSFSFIDNHEIAVIHSYRAYKIIIVVVLVVVVQIQTQRASLSLSHSFLYTYEYLLKTMLFYFVSQMSTSKCLQACFSLNRPTNESTFDSFVCSPNSTICQCV